MRINSILKKLGLPTVSYNHYVEQITDDSRNCSYNTLFVAIKGKRNDGKNYIEQAIHNGAKTVITEVSVMEFPGVNYIYVLDAKRILALLLKIFYHDVSKKINLIGVIGTNGKTTVSTLGFDFFNWLGKKSLLIGSNGIFYQGIRIKTDNTTPSITIIYEYLNKAYNLGIRYVFMEVSSIAIAELRCLGLTYKALIYTNFSEDHLDYHKNMDNYFYTKTIPFYKLNKGVAIVNIDDYKSKELIQNVDSKVITYGYKNGEYKALEPTVTKNGISFDYLELKFSSKMLGSFNIYNILSILVLSDYFGIDLRLYQKFLSDYNGVSGRMNLIDNSKMVIIDYAHTEEAVKQVVYEALNICNGKLYIVIGCGGNREKEKRSKIGEFLDNFSGGVILTTDNPRFEDPIDIISDIKSNMKNEVITIISRKEAIEYALNKMNDDDCLLILGKGSEDYMEVMGIKYQYSDLEVCNDWFRSH